MSCSRDRCPVIREPLESLTLNRHQPADVQSRRCGVKDDIWGAFALSGALGRGHRAVLIVVAPLLGKKLADTMLICSSKGISDFRRISRSISSRFLVCVQLCLPRLRMLLPAGYYCLRFHTKKTLLAQQDVVRYSGCQSHGFHTVLTADVHVPVPAASPRVPVGSP